MKKYGRVVYPDAIGDKDKGEGTPLPPTDPIADGDVVVVG